MTSHTLSPEKIKSVIGMLESDQDGEVIAAARHLRRMARDRKLNLNEFLVVSGVAPRSRQAPDDDPLDEFQQRMREFANRAAGFNWAQKQQQAQARGKHQQATIEIVRRILAKVAGTTALNDEELAFLRDCHDASQAGITISAGMAQRLGVLARKVGAQ